MREKLRRAYRGPGGGGYSVVELLLSSVLMMGTPFAPPPNVLRYPPEDTRVTSS